MEKLHCKRCGHEWYPRDPNKTVGLRCGKCKTLLWDKEPLPGREGKPGSVGRPVLLPQVDSLEIGQQTLVEWPPIAEKGDLYKERRKINPAVHRRGIALTRKFVTTALPKGLMVKRVG